MRRTMLIPILVLGLCGIVSAYEHHVSWIHGEIEPDRSIVPDNPTTEDIIHFSMPTDIYANQWVAELNLGGTPTLSIDPVAKTIKLRIQGPPPGGPIPTLWDPVCGLEGSFGPLEEGRWLFDCYLPGVIWLVWIDVRENEPPPDLYDDGESCRSFSPQTVEGGQPFEISCDIRNGGDMNPGRFSGRFNVEFYASEDTHLSRNDHYIGEETVWNISAGSYVTCEWSGEFPTDIPPGQYYVGWIIDADNEVFESDETNNTAYKEGYKLTVVSQVIPPATFFDDFNDGVFDPIWDVEQHPFTIEETGGEVRIHGTTVESGWGGNGIVTGGYPFPQGDFTVSVDFRVPEFFGPSWRLVYLLAHSSAQVGIFFSGGNYYRVQSWDPYEFSKGTLPLFGDEATNFHTMKLTYDFAAQIVTGYVDDILVGSLYAPMSGNMGFTVGPATDAAGMVVDTRFDNFYVEAAEPNTLPPVAHWKLDETQGNVAYDSAGDNHGILFGKPIWQTTGGMVGGALEFDGYDDYVLADDARQPLNGSDALTVALWVKSDVTNTDKGFIHFEDPHETDDRGMRFDAVGLNGGGMNLIKIGVTSDATEGPPNWPGRQQLESSSEVQTTDWLHLVMTWRSGEQLKLYINGVLDTPTANEPALSGTLTGYTKVIIGMGGKYFSPGTDAMGWDGLIDDVRIYDQALNAEEIEALYLEGVITPPPLSEALDTALDFTTGGSADWFSQTKTSYYDGDAAQSGDISDEQESWMQTTVSGTGTVKFYWKVSSEEDFDFLEFYIDGSLQDQISGSVNWQQKIYTISTSGSHTLEWRYLKDGATSIGDDCGWVDKVEWVTAP